MSRCGFLLLAHSIPQSSKGNLKMLFQLLSILSTLAVISATPLDDYVWKADPNYGWVDMVNFDLPSLFIYE